MNPQLPCPWAVTRFNPQLHCSWTFTRSTPNLPCLWRVTRSNPQLPCSWTVTQFNPQLPCPWTGIRSCPKLLCPWTVTRSNPQLHCSWTVIGLPLIYPVPGQSHGLEITVQSQYLITQKDATFAPHPNIQCPTRQKRSMYFHKASNLDTEYVLPLHRW